MASVDFRAISCGVQVDPETGDAHFHLDREDGEVFEFVMDQDAVEGALLESVKFAINQRNHWAANARLVKEWRTAEWSMPAGRNSVRNRRRL